MGTWRKQLMAPFYPFNRTLSTFVPQHSPVLQSDIKILKDFIRNSKKMFILTGAGVSTESGIPDYRSDKVGLYARTNHKPIQYQEFLKSTKTRTRYWARNYVGWDKFSKCNPNATHVSLRNLEVEHKKVNILVTQNVDSLHFKAGSEKVIELHGTAYRVICLNCKSNYKRSDIQDHMKELNPFLQETSTMIRPDGDVDIPREHVERFNTPTCLRCGGILKPDIVFFGDNVPKERVQEIERCLTDSDAILVLGSSLAVFSGYRFILQAQKENKKIAIVNIGPTRADKITGLKISARCGDILPNIC